MSILFNYIPNVLKPATQAIRKLQTQLQPQPQPRPLPELGSDLDDPSFNSFNISLISDTSTSPDEDDDDPLNIPLFAPPIGLGISTKHRPTGTWRPFTGIGIVGIHAQGNMSCEYRMMSGRRDVSEDTDVEVDLSHPRAFPGMMDDDDDLVADTPGVSSILLEEIMHTWCGDPLHERSVLDLIRESNEKGEEVGGGSCGSGCFDPPTANSNEARTINTTAPTNAPPSILLSTPAPLPTGTPKIPQPPRPRPSHAERLSTPPIGMPMYRSDLIPSQSSILILPIRNSPSPPSPVTPYMSASTAQRPSDQTRRMRHSSRLPTPVPLLTSIAAHYDSSVPARMGPPQGDSVSDSGSGSASSGGSQGRRSRGKPARKVWK